MIFFSITILYIKCMDLKTWSTCISIPVFARVNHRSCISFIFTSPLQTRTCEIPWVQHAWHPGDFWNLRSNLDAINVKSAMFKTLCCLKIAGGFTSQCIGDYQGAPINQPAYCNQMGLEHCWCESSTWIDVWHMLAPCMVNNSYFF